MEINGTKTIFIDRLRGLMQTNGLSLTQLSVSVKISASTLSQWLNGKRAPQMDAIVKLAKFFECSTDYLLGLEN